MKTGIELITDERRRHKEKEGWTREHDNTHVKQELAKAAACYALPDHLREKNKNGRPKLFPWSRSWWRPAINKESVVERIRELEKAGALCAAEIDRLIDTINP